MYNTITVVGRAGRDAEMRYTPNGDSVTNFSLASPEKRWQNSNGEWEEETLWFQCAVWGKGAEAAAGKILKGTPVTVTGKLGMRDYQTRSGENRTQFTIRVFNWYALNDASQQNGGSRSPQPQAEAGYQGSGYSPTPAPTPTPAPAAPQPKPEESYELESLPW